MQSKASHENFAKQILDIKELAGSSLVFRQRSTRLADRLHTLVTKIPEKYENLDKIDLYAKNAIKLLSVTLDDVVDHYKLISLKSPALDVHLLKYGSDEECYSKWNERLRLIFSNLGIETSSEIFDLNVDRLDLQEDIKNLRNSISSITENSDNNHEILKLLKAQETNAYKTVQCAERDMILEVKTIKYDKLLGAGNNKSYSRSLW